MDITLISRYFDTKNGGAGSHSKLIYESLKKQENLNIKLLSQENSLFSSYNQLSYLFYTSIDLKRIIKKDFYEDSDVFHALTPLESMHIDKKKGIVSILDFIPLMNKCNTNFSSTIFAKYFNKSIKEAIKCERIIANNEDIKNKLITSYNIEEESITVIPPPIDIKYYPLNKKNSVYTIGTISNLMKRKRINILIESFLEADIDNSQLLIGGNGTEKQNLLKLTKGDNRVKFLGFVPDENMNDFYNSLDVFVFPTLVEGYGMPIIEAMACGKPVITLNDAIIPSNIKNRTITCDKKDLSEVLKSESFDFNKKENIKFYKNHSMKKTSEQLIKVYETI
jgi:glycosyltransferase involved in cell wall biosynthesis